MTAMLWVALVVAAAVIGASLYASRKGKGGSYKRDDFNSDER